MSRLFYREKVVETGITGYTVCLDSIFQNSPLLRETGLFCVLRKGGKFQQRFQKLDTLLVRQRFSNLKEKEICVWIRVSVKSVS